MDEAAGIAEDVEDGAPEAVGGDVGAPVEEAEQDATESAEAPAGDSTTQAEGAAAEETADTAPERSGQFGDALSRAPAETGAEAQADADAGAETEAGAAADTGEGQAETGEGQAETGEGQAETGPESVAEPAVEMPGPDATAEEIVQALSGMPEGERRDALLARLEQMQTREEAAAAERTEARAPDPEEQAQREDMARDADEQALESEALDVIEAGAEAVAGAAVETETEVVTDETSRSFDEEMAEAAAAGDDGDAGEALRNILGGAAAGFVIGQLLDSGDEVVGRTEDRVIVNRDGEYVVLKDENTLLRRPGATVETENYADGSSRTAVTREDGTEVVTVRAPDGRILYRARIEPDGRRVVLIDERRPAEPIRAGELPASGDRRVVEFETGTSPDALARALGEAEAARALDRTFSLRQVLYNQEVRELMPRVDLDAITFPTGSAAIQPSQAEELAALGNAMERMIDENPDELFLIEGHTDTVGGEVMNLALSDRRAESVALALTEYFGIPPENMVTQGYGERFLKYPVEGDVRENRRAAVRRITPLIRAAAR
jgi:outer membrane protein OmpA-like peptidoglycan-associated protein